MFMIYSLQYGDVFCNTAACVFIDAFIEMLTLPCHVTACLQKEKFQ